MPGARAEEAVLITGTSSGLGRAAAVALAADGLTVIAGVRTPGEAPTVAQGELHEIVLDVTRAEDLAEIAAQVGEILAGRPLRGLINNAGIGVGGPLEHVPMDQLRYQFEVNVFGQVALTQAVLRPLRLHGNGRIVFMSSIGGTIAAPFFGPYAASKHALNGIAAAFRRELWPSGIRVSTIVAGAVAGTEIWSKASVALDDVTRSLPADGLDRYGRGLRGARAYVERARRGRALAAERVIRAMRHAIWSPRPKPVYVVGVEARGGLAMSRLLAPAMLDRLVRHLLD